MASCQSGEGKYQLLARGFVIVAAGTEADGWAAPVIHPHLK